MKVVFHKELAAGRWFTFSLAEQLGHIGSEVGRARKWQDKDEAIFQGAVERALELFDLTIADPRWKNRLREIARAREVFCDAVLGGKEYGSSLESLEEYFFPFAMAAQASRD
ncbi:MAG: hypothetical protein Q7R48_00215 [bacterium]|nr:hypothetical protein [bacterium]